MYTASIGSEKLLENACVWLVAHLETLYETLEDGVYYV